MYEGLGFEVWGFGGLGIGGRRIYLLGAPETENRPGHQVVVHREPDPETGPELRRVECEQPVGEEEPLWVGAEVRVAEKTGLE